MSAEPVFENANGTLTPYAFACGYCENWDGNGRLWDSFYAGTTDRVTLYRDGLWHVKTRRGHNLYWDSFDTLTEARRWVLRARSAIRRGVAMPGNAWNVTTQRFEDGGTK